MIKIKQQGFTLIEVMLFLAMSGILFVVIYRSIDGTIGRAEFTESARDLQSALQLQLNEVSTGISDGAINDCNATAGSINFSTTTDSSSGNSESCVTLGKAITVGSDQLQVDTLVGRRLNSELFDESDQELVRQSFPTRYKDGASLNSKSIEYRWGATVEEVRLSGNTGSSSAVNTTSSGGVFSFVRNPRSSDILTIAYTDPTKVDYDLSGNPYTTATIAYKADIDICLTHDGRYAIIGVGKGLDSREVTLDLGRESC